MSKFYSPPDRAYPQALPDYWKFDDGSIRTDLQTLSDAELELLGWHGPITMPDDIANTSKFTHSYTWNPDTLSFDVAELSFSDKNQNINYTLFWSLLISGIHITNYDDQGQITDQYPTEAAFYNKIREESKHSLEINMIVTEFISLIFDAKMGSPDVKNIQRNITEIFSSINFTSEELLEFQTIFDISGMSAVYTLE